MGDNDETMIRYAARGKSSGKFAREGHETGIGRAITDTNKISAAKLSTSPTGIMTWMGGHYRGYEAVKVTVRYELGDVEPFPSEQEVWPEDRS